ncbi:uncharacterized protein LOC125573650 isoform X2 [Nematostella vectensis]|uniref:uncharacterized protein LOC125573650 isoform X2 n=1 Tax=Nematostella vectensis TaxID=45351 RepID=UPI002076E095|nr:uncharacterized protein LOC125573650 isoform X2 [Nematostella vectensis]
MRSSNVLRYIESAGLSEDLSEFESENVSAGSRLATKNETAVHVESTARLYELRLIQMEKFAIREKDTAILFGENSRPFRAATIKTFLDSGCRSLGMLAHTVSKLKGIMMGKL